MGSRILSRSFTVERWQPDEEEDTADDSTESKPPTQHSDNDAMDVDETPTHEDHHEKEEEGDEDGDDASDIAMVPMADMLNARFGTENVTFVYCSMTSYPLLTILRPGQTIPRERRPQDDYYKANQTRRADSMYILPFPYNPLTHLQWNTYGDLPNAELLRRYGHVDLLALADGRQGNPGDVVELGADVIVEVVKQICQKGDDLLAERIDWWLEEGGDE